MSAAGDYIPQTAFEAVVLETLRTINVRLAEIDERAKRDTELRDRQFQQYERLRDRVAKPLDFYERMVPYGLERWLPELLQSANTTDVLRTMAQHRRVRLGILIAIFTILPGWIALVVALFNFLVIHVHYKLG